MNKIDRRKNYYIVLDTETCPLDRDFEGVSPDNMWVYDLGFAVVDKKGTVYESYSYIIRDIFIGEAELMKSAYYANKIPMYWKQVKEGSREIKSFYEAGAKLKEICKKYNVKAICAHNARFDYGALNNTQRWLTKSKYRYFYPYGIPIYDTLKMASDTIGKQKSYIKFCERNGFMTAHKKPRPQLKAETLYRYMTNNPDFVESHTGLEDVMIEKEIMARCFRQHKKMRKALFE